MFIVYVLPFNYREVSYKIIFPCQTTVALCLTEQIWITELAQWGFRQSLSIRSSQCSGDHNKKDHFGVQKCYTVHVRLYLFKEKK